VEPKGHHEGPQIQAELVDDHEMILGQAKADIISGAVVAQVHEEQPKKSYSRVYLVAY